MKVLSFRLQGKMAHFRRYYSNSSALTYSVPPRTTIVGILAGLLGYERDSYYEQFNLEQCQIAVACQAPIKKTVQKLNLLMIKNLKTDANGYQENHSQSATELVIPQNIRNGILDYQIWVHHKSPEIMERLFDMVSNAEPAFRSEAISLALGSAWNLGWMKFDGVFEGEIVQHQELEVGSVIPLHLIEELTAPPFGQASYRLVKEDLPLEFDSNRRLTEKGKNTMVINLLSHPIHARVTEAVRLDNQSSIVWMS